MNIERPLLVKKPQTSLMALSARFRQKDEGSVTFFALFMIIMMLGISGIAVDFMRAERNRTVLQHTLDRAILAAADLDQERPADVVVRDYFEAAGLESTLQEVTVDEGINYKTLYASAEVNTHAPWLDILGRFNQNRADTAIGREVDESGRFVARKECSSVIEATEVPKLDDYGQPVLDADGNPVMMAQSQITLPACDDLELPGAPRTASMLASAEGAAEERVQKVEVSLILDISGSMAWNNKMPTLKSAASSFIDAVLDPANEDLVTVSLVPYSEQVNAGSVLFSQFKRNHQHDYSHCFEFEHGDFSFAHMNLTQTYYQAQHFQWNYSGSNDRTDTICPRYSYESIIPLSQDANELKAQINQLQPRAGTQIHIGMKWGTALLAPDFRPVTNNLVTEGVVDTVFTERPLEYNDPEVLKTIVLMTDGKNSKTSRLREWAYNSTSDYAHWNQYNLWYYLNNYVSSNKRNRFYREKYSAVESDEYTHSICNAAKEKGIVIWTIGFEVDDHGANVMQSCASSPSHFFRVEGIEISDAFAAIARQINQLRLTQ